MTCTDGEGHETTVVIRESAGVFRENLIDLRTEIYGSFNIGLTSEDSAESLTDLDCSFTIDHSSEAAEGTFGGGCTDGSGEVLEPPADVTCVDRDR